MVEIVSQTTRQKEHNCVACLDLSDQKGDKIKGDFTSPGVQKGSSQWPKKKVLKSK